MLPCLGGRTDSLAARVGGSLPLCLFRSSGFEGNQKNQNQCRHASRRVVKRNQTDDTNEEDNRPMILEVSSSSPQHHGRVNDASQYPIHLHLTPVGREGGDVHGRLAGEVAVGGGAGRIAGATSSLASA